MVGKTAEELANEFNKSDIFRFEWAILKYMCDTSDKHDTFIETELFFKTGLHGYIDKKYGQEYLHGKERNLYKLIMERVMKSLKSRSAIEMTVTNTHGSKMTKIKKSQILEDKCDEFRKAPGMGDDSLLNRILPSHV
jgi:hypothetical protein